jgi:hypothetical protein
MSQAKLLTSNLVTNYQHIQIVRNYSSLLKKGVIATALCHECEKSELNLIPSSTLLVHGTEVTLEELLAVSIKYKEDYIRIQYYEHNMTINYIEWGQNPKEVGAPQ